MKEDSVPIRESLIEKVAAWMPRDWPVTDVRIRRDATDYFDVD